jgi:hypothetical protein
VGVVRRAAAVGGAVSRAPSVHESPTLITDQLRLLRHSRHRVSGVSEVGGYPDLANTERPIRLKHSLRAIRAHDEVVSYMMAGITDPEWHAAISDLDAQSRGFFTIREMLGWAADWRSLKHLADEWEQVGESAARCDIREYQDFILELARRTRLKRLD